MEKKEKTELKQMMIRIPAELRNQIKSWAYYRNSSLQQYVLEAVIERMKRDTEFNK